jgi:NAD(P)-dependent dehydrogenase (short-subunit alcohol dehydrogenase family)
MTDVGERFSLDGKLALVTGGAGVLCSAICRGLCEAGAHVLVTHRRAEAAEALAAGLREAGHRATGFGLDVMDRESLAAAAGRTGSLGGLDILINGVGGNRKGATTAPDLPFHHLPREAIEEVMGLNFLGGALLTAQAFAPQMAGRAGGGAILHISSMSASRPLTRVPGYSAAKAAVENFTRWLAVHLANAVAPGFFLTAQNRFLLTDEATGELSARGRRIVEHTPMGRFGDPEDLVGTAIWLCSDAARFVTGVVVAVDGGFSAYAGV